MGNVMESATHASHDLFDLFRLRRVALLSLRR